MDPAFCFLLSPPGATGEGRCTVQNPSTGNWEVCVCLTQAAGEEEPLFSMAIPPEKLPESKRGQRKQ